MSVRKSGRRRRFVITLFAMGLIFAFGYYTGYIDSRYNLITLLPGRVSALLAAPQTPGRWAPLRTPPRNVQRSADAIRQLESIGYLAGYYPRPNITGIAAYDSEQAYPGLNLYTSGHAAKAFLMTLDGAIVHEWSYDFRKVWPDYTRRNDAHGRVVFKENTV